MADGFTMDDVAGHRGETVYSSDGNKIGVVQDIYADIDTRQPEWMGVGTGIFRSKHVLVPVYGAEFRGDGVYVPYTKEQVSGSPDIDAQEISEENERELYAYYGIPVSESRSDTTLPAGGAPRTGTETTGEGSVTRAEEELAVGKRAVESGRVRLRKWVETEPVAADVEVRRETAVVEREPINEPVSGAELGEQEVEVPLTTEEPVVQKQTVAKERVSLGKDVQTARETVTDEVRKERIEVEGEDVAVMEGDQPERTRGR